MPNPEKLAALRARYPNDRRDEIADPALRRAAEAAFNTEGRRPLPYAGVSTLLDAPYRADADLAGLDVALVGVPMRRVIRIIQEQRDARYSLLRGFFRGADDGSTDETQQERLSSLSLPLHARSIGRQIGDLPLTALGVKLVSLRRKTGQVMPLTDNLLLMEGDALVLSGKANPIRQAEHLLLKG